jgi:hypothetical protein
MNIIISIALLSTVACIKLCLYIAIIYYISKNNITIPDYLLNLIYSLSYNSIYYYSKLQLGFMKTKNNVIKYVKSISFLNNLLTFTKENNSIYTYTIINDHLSICSKYDREKNMYHKIIINFIPDNEEKKNIESSNIEEANYKFIMTEITIDNKKFVIQFTTDKYNYLIVTNGLDSEFIKYFLKTHYSEMIRNLEIEKYTIKIIDHNVNIVEFDNSKMLYIEKDDYNILTSDK